jgi:hypothetical protein
VWTDTEDPGNQRAAWRRIWSRVTEANGRPLTDNPQRAGRLQAKHNTLTVYRGWKLPHRDFAGTAEVGWSWTTDRAKALWFATRFQTPGMVSTAVVPVSKTLGLFWGRGESEVVLPFGAARIVDSVPASEFFTTMMRARA